MKKIALLLTVVLCLCALGVQGAFAPVCAAEGAFKMTLTDGDKHVVGEDIPAGEYRITCVKTAGDMLQDYFGALGDMMDAFSDGSDRYGESFDAYGEMYGDLLSDLGVTVQIIGNYGDVIKSYTMQQDDTFTIALEENTAIKVVDGTCTLERD